MEKEPVASWPVHRYKSEWNVLLYKCSIAIITPFHRFEWFSEVLCVRIQSVQPEEHEAILWIENLFIDSIRWHRVVWIKSKPTVPQWPSVIRIFIYAFRLCSSPPVKSSNLGIRVTFHCFIAVKHKCYKSISYSRFSLGKTKMSGVYINIITHYL